jgi:omega-6 fatty acid desaturase (delta-12 desaturase)
VAAVAVAVASAASAGNDPAVEFSSPWGSVIRPPGESRRRITGPEESGLNDTAHALPTPADLRPFQAPTISGSLWQLTNSVVPYVALWVLMVKTISFSYPLTFLLAIVASAFLVRVFIIFHDCGHGSFFRSRRANEWVGFFTGLLTLTPHHEWWHSHALHHAQTGNLDKRGSGDVWTMTVEEYNSASRYQKILYFLVRQPLFMLTVGPLLVFVVQARFPHSTSRARERRSIIMANLVLAAAITTLCLTIGWKTYLAIHLPITIMAGAAGIWLFYVQHQFEDTYWSQEKGWDFHDAAVMGSSFYKLPRVLQWFSGNIGFHHVHHMSPKIPNYLLEKCHRAFPAFERAPVLTVKSSMKSAHLRLWDSRRRKLVGWREARRA